MYHSFYAFLIILILFTNCKGQNSSHHPHKYTNQLSKETSPYLLQHAHNPVNWHAWNPETLEKAKKENKLLLISIGYSACHWCHVMEHESFENEEVAKLMNDNFINIKIDREERPDIDQIYINAVQLMTGSAGWPLNCIALPNGKPFWGGTYFPKENWTNALTQIANVHKTNPEKLEEYAEKLTQGIQQSEIVQANTSEITFELDTIKKSVQQWSTLFDTNLGGMNRVPKFPMPNNYHFLLRHAHQTQNDSLKDYVFTTLTKMALGGIYDPINGAFSRYATDEKWHIPHFEKMLYDNAQLVSLYSDAYLITKNELYKKTVIQTLEFIERELTNTEGAFYSSLDADSLNKEQHLEEGAYYVWTKAELQKLITTDFDLFSKYYNVNSYGHWEEDKYHLIRKETDEDFAKNNHLELSNLTSKVKTWDTILLKARQQKPRPRLDDKTLTSWNALMLKGYLDAYRVFNNPNYLKIALKNAHFLKNQQLTQQGRLYHNYKNGKSTINGYLIDYATVIDAYLKLYEATLDEQWLNISNTLTEYCFAHFFDKNSGLFFFTSNIDPQLITRKIEINDNVIPSSNSILANNLFKLGHYFYKPNYIKTSKKMLHHVSNNFVNYGSAYANWMNTYSNFSSPFYEIAIVGEHAIDKIKELNQIYIPNKLIAGSSANNNMPLLKDRYMKGKTLIYTCIDGACKLPTTDIQTTFEEIQN